MRHARLAVRVIEKHGILRGDSLARDCVGLLGALGANGKGVWDWTLHLRHVGRVCKMGLVLLLDGHGVWEGLLVQVGRHTRWMV